MAGQSPSSNNLYFSAVSLIILCVVATFITERMIEPRLGAYDFTSTEAVAVRAAEAAGGQQGKEGRETQRQPRRGDCALPSSAHSASWSIVLLATLPPGAPLRDPADRQHHRHYAVHG